jgi:hypothetical protein
MPITPGQKKTLIQSFREGGTVHAAAKDAGITDEEAAEILRSEGFDLEERDWFFEEAADAYFKIWKSLLPIRRRFTSLGSWLADHLPGGNRLRKRWNSFSDWFKSHVIAWSGRNPVKKSVTFLFLASVLFTAYWLIYPEWQFLVTFFFILTFFLGSGLLYVHTRSRRLFGSSVSVLLFYVIYQSTPSLYSLDISFTAALVLEGFRAILIPIIAWSFMDCLRQATGFLEKLRAHVPLVSRVVTLILFIAGAVVAYVELYLLTAYTTDTDSVLFVTRYGLSYLLWALASTSLLFTHVYLLYMSSISSVGPLTTRRIAVVMFTGVILIAFIGTNAVNILVAHAGPPPGPMRLGIHSGNVTDALNGPWDRFAHFEVAWDHVEREKGVMNWTKFDIQVDLAESNNIELYLLISPIAPPWYVQENMDAVMRDQDGDVFRWVDEDPNKEITRVWDFSFAAEKVVLDKENFTREVALRYANRSPVVAVSIQNEPTYPGDFDAFRFASYDDHTVSAFRTWLQNEYGTIDNFNDAHNRDHSDWGDIEAPKGAGSKLWDDWLDFREQLLVSFVQRLVDTTRSVTTKPVTIKIMAHYLARYSVVQTGLTGLVIESYIEMSDIVSLDIYPLGRPDLRRALIYYKSLAGDKPIWLAEFNLFLGCTTPGSGSAMYASLMEISRYAERTLFYTYGGHYLYGFRLYDSVPGLVGIRMFKEVRDGGSLLGQYGNLVLTDIGAIPNLYYSYVLASDFANFPVIPWPILVLFLIPIPVADVEKKKKVKKYFRIIALVLLLIATVIANLGF